MKMPNQMHVGEWTINYLCFTKPINAYKAPIIFLGGAFQTFKSLDHEVEQLSKDAPVYLVDLPGQGGNPQCASDLTFEDYSNLLKVFLDNLGIDACSIIAQSYSSIIAYNFASLYPERTKKVVIGGATSKIRDSVRHLLEESLHQLAKDKLEKFASGLVLNMMNFSQRHHITGSKELNAVLYKSILNFSDTDKKRYRDNFSRLMEHQGLPRAPQCPVLVISGEFDNFTTPFENFQVAKACAQSTYVVIKGADHLATFEKKDVLTRLYRRYITDQPLNRMKDVEVIEKNEFPRERIRMEPRWLLNDVGFLDSGNGVFVPVNIVDINNFGCRLYTSFKDHKSLKRSQKFLLHIPGEDLQMETILFKQADNGHYRGIFQHQCFDGTRKFEGFIDKVSTTCSTAYCA